MHIPPYYKRRGWQRFFLGFCLGGVIAYCIFIFMYGKMYERLLEENFDLQAQMSEHKSRYEALLEDKESLDEKAKQPITVDRIEVRIKNEKQLRFDRLISYQLEEMIKKEINHIIGKDIQIIAESDQFIITSIENKAFSIDDFSYYFDIKKLIISQTVKITVEGKLSQS